MNSKGFYNSMIALIIVVLIASFMFIQGTVSQTRKAETEQRAIFELKWAMQNMQYLLDKAAGDAMADQAKTYAIPPSCTVPTSGSGYGAKIEQYFNNITSAITTDNFGISCNRIFGLGVTNGVAFQFTLRCSKAVGATGFSVWYQKTITLQKTASATLNAGPPQSCTIRVLDNQSNTYDV